MSKKVSYVTFFFFYLEVFGASQATFDSEGRSKSIEWPFEMDPQLFIYNINLFAGCWEGT
jgi:hypothetical protein